MTRNKTSKLQEELSPESLLQEGLNVLKLEIVKIKTGKFDKLMPENASKTLNDYLRTIIQLQKEQRYSSIEDNLANIDDKEFRELAAQASKYLAEPDAKFR